MNRTHAPEDSTLVDDERPNHDVAEHASRGQDLQPTGCRHISLDRAGDDDVAAGDSPLDLPVVEMA